MNKLFREEARFTWSYNDNIFKLYARIGKSLTTFGII